MQIDWQALATVAEQASHQAYAKFSKFPVGAAVLSADGRIFAGCNVENSSYGLSMCAERSAVFAAVVAGARELVAVVVFTPTDEPTSPCGACRQVIAEFAEDLPIRIVSKNGNVADHSLNELLPQAFRFNA